MRENRRKAPEAQREEVSTSTCSIACRSHGDSRREAGARRRRSRALEGQRDSTASRRPSPAPAGSWRSSIANRQRPRCARSAASRHGDVALPEVRVLLDVRPRARLAFSIAHRAAQPLAARSSRARVLRRVRRAADSQRSRIASTSFSVYQWLIERISAIVALSLESSSEKALDEIAVLCIRSRRCCATTSPSATRSPRTRFATSPRRSCPRPSRSTAHGLHRSATALDHLRRPARLDRRSCAARRRWIAVLCLAAARPHHAARTHGPQDVARAVPAVAMRAFSRGPEPLRRAQDRRVHATTPARNRDRASLSPSRKPWTCCSMRCNRSLHPARRSSRRTSSPRPERSLQAQKPGHAAAPTGARALCLRGDAVDRGPAARALLRSDGRLSRSADARSEPAPASDDAVRSGARAVSAGHALVRALAVGARLRSAVERGDSALVGGRSQAALSALGRASQRSGTKTCASSAR